MAAASTDYFTKVGDPGTATTLAAPGHTVAGTSITVGSTSNWPTTTGAIFAMDTVSLVNGVQVRNAGTYTEWEGIVTSGTDVANMVLRFGTDQNYPAGSTTRVYIPVASSRENRMVDGIVTTLNQDGTLKTGIVTSAKLSGIDKSLTTTDSNPYKFSTIRTNALNSVGAAFTKLVFDTERFDTNNNFATGTYTVPVSGFYQFNAKANATNPGQIIIALYKNGSIYERGGHNNNAGGVGSAVYADLVQCTAADTIEIWVYTDNTVAYEVGSTVGPIFSGYLVSRT